MKAKTGSDLMDFLIKSGIDAESGDHESYRMKSDGFQDLVVETWPNGRYLVVSVCHYGEMNGDLMCNPEVVLFFERTEKKALVASFKNDYTATYSTACVMNEDGTVNTDKIMHDDISEFANEWADNLRAQGHKIQRPRQTADRQMPKGDDGTLGGVEE